MSSKNKQGSGRGQALTIGFGLVVGVLAIVAAPVAYADTADEAVAGEHLFRQKCAMCHSLDPNGASSIGPNLAKINGRAAGSLEGYRYSPAMRKSAIAWERESLEQFMKAPRALIPYSKMSISVPDPVQRQEIAEFLVSLD